MAWRGWASWGLLGSGVLAVAWVLQHEATFFPDGYELAAAGACFWGLPGSPALPCAALDLGYTTPLFPLLAGPLGALLGLWSGVQVLALLALALCWVPLQRLAAGLGGPSAALAALILLAMSPELGAWAVVPDERPLALLLSAGAWTAAVTAQDRRGALLAGGLAGLGVWARPEALALAVLVPGGLLLLRRPLAPWAALSAVLVAGGWLLVQRAVGGTWTPRPYEVAALQLLLDLPDVWAKRLVGMGAWSPPLRAWALAGGQAAPAGSLSPDPLAASRWTLQALSVGTHPALWLAAGMGTAAALWSAPQRRMLLATAGLTLPWLAASAILHARLDALPLANLLAVLLALCVLAGAGIAEVCRVLLPPRPGLRLGAAGLLAAGLGTLWPLSPVRPGVELTPTGLAAAAWLRAQPGTVVSSYESAPIVFRADQPWRERPTPFEPDRWRDADYLLLTHLDADEPLHLGAPPPSTSRTAVAAWTWQGEWTRIYRLSDDE